MKRAAVLLLAWLPASAQEPPAFAAAMRGIEARVEGTLGVAGLHLETGRLAGWRAKERFPLIELAQLPVALHAFAQMELGEMPFHMMLRIEPGDFGPGHSPLRERYPQGGVVTVGQLLEAAVRDNDASASDKLLALGGGLRIDRSFADLAVAIRYAASPARFLLDERDSATPEAFALLMSSIEEGKLLHPSSHERLRQWMRATPHGAARLPADMKDAVRYRKSGSTAYWDGKNICMSVAAVADLPGGRGRLALTVFLKGSERDLTQRETALADAAGELYRWFASLPEK